MKTFILYLFVCGSPNYVILADGGKIYTGFIDKTPKQTAYLMYIESKSEDRVFTADASPKYGCA